MANLRDLLDALPFDDSFLRKVPIPGVQGRCLLEIDLARGLAEGSPASPVEAYRARHTPMLAALVDGLRRAAGDARVLGLVVHCAGGAPVARVAELRRAVRAFSVAGKPTLAWAESYGELAGGSGGYLLATACDEIWLQPSGEIVLRGAVAQGIYARGALDKLGILPQASARKEYKSGLDPFIREDMSEAEREMLTALVASLNTSAAQDIATARDLDPEQVRACLDEGLLPAQRALEAGLVDHLGYRDEALAAMHRRVGDDKKTAELRYVERYRSSLPGREAVANRGKPVVAVVQALGPIHLGRSGSQPFGGRSVGSDTIGAALRQAGRDKHVKAVVLRVDSPGGSYVASDAIRREVLALREQGTPVVASMGVVAASGGYFIAMPCQAIVANAQTLTGSIGVLAGKQVVAEGLGRIGIRMESVAQGERDEMFSSRRPFTQEEWDRLNAWLDQVYEDFTRKAARDRLMLWDDLEPLARGRVWTGADAAERGLVDEIGGMEEAIVRVCAAAELDRSRVDVRILPKVGPLDMLMPAESSEATSASLAAGPEGLIAQLGGALGLADSSPLGAALRALASEGRGVLSMPDIRVD